MKKAILFISLLFLLYGFSFGQTSVKDSLRNELAVATQDSSKVLLLLKLCIQNYGIPDSAFFYGTRAFSLARQINYPDAELRVIHHIVMNQIMLGNESKGFQLAKQGIKIAEKNQLRRGKAQLLMDIGDIYSNTGQYSKALTSYRESILFADSAKSRSFSIIAQSRLGLTFALMNEKDSALYYGKEALENAANHNREFVLTIAHTYLGKIYNLTGDTDNALKNLRFHSFRNSTNAEDIARVYRQKSDLDSSIFYAKRAIEIANQNRVYANEISASLLLSELYEKIDIQKSLQFSNLAIAWQDTLNALANSTTFEYYETFDELERQYELDIAKSEYNLRIQNLWTLSISGALLSLIIVAFILYRNNKNKQKANAQLKEQKEEIQSTLEQLESTQSQLIQSEKMASLGELTAGIAHEIQNPLNFVNNFSEVSGELIDEMKEELTAGHTADVQDIAEDLKQNLEKIQHHGSRASGIVKGMLEHSRISDGKRELTDINALADEYLRLAYHGIRAKDKSFNADYKLDLDENMPKIHVVPQDIGRVLLNLINNAFYAVTEKAARHSARKGGLPSGRQESGAAEERSSKNDYHPEVTVATKKHEKSMEIIVADNGQGIPEQVRDKIFQPFFTTKPTGSGTGLGLSLSYDIITKGHNGHLEVETEEGMGTRFIIRLPIV